ncbi:MAG TPA: hypothetical protein VF857_10790 [Spirochaetota bacterium]
MIRHEVLELKEQKYVGIKTTILFKDADKVDFSQLHKDVHAANISNIDHHEHMMAMDTDFTESSFSYTPLVPVHSYDHNERYTQFTRKQGTYYAFEVKASELNPVWFKNVFEYFKEKRITIENTGYDLEYYEENYSAMINGSDVLTERVLKILFKMQS